MVLVARRDGPSRDSETVTAGASSTVEAATTAPTTTAPVRVVELADPAASGLTPVTPATVAATTAPPTTPPPTTAIPTTTKPTTTAKPPPTTTVTTAPTSSVLDTAPPATAPPSSVLVDPGVSTGPADRLQEGRGTFHRYDNADPLWGERPCAHRTLPKGTVVTVVNTKSGATTWCIVRDRGPFGNAIIDLDEEQFAELAPVGAGVINVRITW